MKIINISTRQVCQHTCDPDYVLIDIRDEAEYLNGHIPTAINIEPENLVCECLQRFSSKIIMLYCDRGAYSLMMSRELQNRGLHVINISGGYINYQGPVSYT